MRQTARAFVRGDPNEDAEDDIADTVWIVRYLFTGGPAPGCMDSADSNDDGHLDLADGIYILNYNFRGGPRPGDPFFPTCDLDPTPNDGVDCARYRPCE